MVVDQSDNLASIYLPLRLTYGLVPIVAGLDKFFNLLTDWSQYLPEGVSNISPIPVSSLMMVVGCIEIVAGAAVLTRFTRLGAYVVMAWLMMIAATLVASGHLDVAVRDLVMAVGAFTLGRTAAYRHEAWLPFGRGARSAEVIAHVR